MRKLLIFLLFTLFTTALAEPPADVANSKAYKKGNLSFSYPGNWTVTEDESVGDTRYIFVESPDNALAAVIIFNGDENHDLLTTAKEYSKNANEEMPKTMKIKSEGFREFQSEFGPRFREELQIRFLGVSIPHVREYSQRVGSNRVAMLSNQVAKEDLSAALPGFRLIERTFKFLP